MMTIATDANIRTNPITADNVCTSRTFLRTRMLIDRTSMSRCGVLLATKV